MSIRYLIKNIVDWILALSIAFLIVNVLVYTYDVSPGWVERKNGSTLAIWNPNKRIVNATEGFGVYTVDKRGYLNTNGKIAEDYILCVGSSYTQGKEVMMGERFTDILNEMLGGNDNLLKVYNVSQDGHFLPELLAGFQNLLREFHAPQAIVIEINSTNYHADELMPILNQREFDINSCGENISVYITKEEKIENNIKEILPILKVIKEQIKLLDDGTTWLSRMDTDNSGERYYLAALEVLNFIRSSYDGRIIVMYHPQINFEKDGSMKTKNEPTTPAFKQACFESGIEFFNTSELFLELYNKEYIVPYGFSNTSMAKGHLNVDGHRMMAEAIYKLISGGSVQ